jgi:hypothetical protein
LGWFPLFIVDAINIGHQNYFMSFGKYYPCVFWNAHKEKLGWFPLFIVDAINIGHQN